MELRFEQFIQEKKYLIGVSCATRNASPWMQHGRDKRDAAKRESGYQTVLAQYAFELRTGMTRDQVERYSQTNGNGSSRCAVLRISKANM